MSGYTGTPAFGGISATSVIIDELGELSKRLPVRAGSVRRYRGWLMRSTALYSFVMVLP